MGSPLGWRSIAAFEPCRSEIIDQDVAWLEERVHAVFGPDTWNDAHTSVRNHLMELYSVKTLRGLVRAQELLGKMQYTHAAVARIDTLITRPVRFQFPPTRPAVVLPIVGTSSTAVNDRFAYGDRTAIVDGHLARYDSLNPKGASSAVHAELLLCCVLRAREVSLYGQMIGVERMSATGAKRSEQEDRQTSKQQATVEHNLRLAAAAGRESTKATEASSVLFRLDAPHHAMCSGNMIHVGDKCYSYTCAADEGTRSGVAEQRSSLHGGVVASLSSIPPMHTGFDGEGRSFKLNPKVACMGQGGGGAAQLPLGPNLLATHAFAATVANTTR